MKKLSLLFFVLLLVRALSASDESLPSYPYAGIVGSETSTAIAKDDAAIVAWATSVEEYVVGTNVDSTWQDSTQALGAAEGSPYDVVSLGRGGEITLSFLQPIYDGPGDDFAVFENSINDTFLELAWVEVSSDGVHFVRYPNFSETYEPVDSNGDVAADKVYGFAGKYRAGYGTPFDLSMIKLAYTIAIEDGSKFPSSYSDDLVANYPHVDFNDIRYVRLIDVVGDGSQVSALIPWGSVDEGYPIYDPYPTVISAGFDLDAVGVINQVDADGLAQSIEFSAIANQRLETGTLELTATATSGLPVSFTLVEGPAGLSGTTLSFTGLGTVIVRAEQEGDESYATAVPVTQSFTVADELQHIYMPPIANQLLTAVDVELSATSSSGLPVSLYIESGPEDATVTELTHLFSSGGVAGDVILRASQDGGESAGVTYAPAEDVTIEFEIVSSGGAAAPRSFTQWQAEYSISGEADTDSDQDGLSDLEEYVAGTDPTDSESKFAYAFEADEEADSYVLTLVLDRRALFDFEIYSTTELDNASSWQSITPELLSVSDNVDGVETSQVLRWRVDSEQSEKRFWRYEFIAD